MKSNEQSAIFAGGCFWCTEAAWHGKEGVRKVVSGFADNFPDENPDHLYMKIAEKQIQAREANLVVYNPEKISYEELVRHFFTIIDPLDDGGQFHDRGFSYTTAIYTKTDEEKEIAEKVIKELNDSGKYDSNIAVLVEDNKGFTPASEYHQNYKEKNPLHYAGYYKGSGREDYFSR